MVSTFVRQLQAINNMFIVFMFVLLVGFLFNANAVDFGWFPLIASVSIFLLADILIFSYLKTRNIFSFRVIFLSLTFLFHMGYSWIFLFNPMYSFDGMNFELMFDANIVLRSYLFSLSACLAVYIGMQIGDFRSQRPNGKLMTKIRAFSNKAIVSQLFTEKSYRNLAIAILAISLPIRLYIDISKFSLSGAGDYLSTFDLEINGYVSMLGDMVVVGIVLLLIYYRNKTPAALAVLFSSIAYYVLSIGSGSRGAAIISIVVLLFAYTICVRKFRATAVIGIGVLAIILASYITSLGLSRVDNAPQLDDRYGTQSRFLQEFGGTQLTTILSMRLADGQGDSNYSYGETYLASLLTIFPNLTVEYEKYIENNNFQKQLNYPTIGGSYIAELYYNFGYFALLFALIVGFILSRFEGLITRFRLKEQFVLLAFAIFIARQSLWWIRDSALVFPRHIVIGLIVLILVCLVLKKFGFIKIANKQTGAKHA